MGGFLSVALLAGFISCSNGTSDETNQAAQGLNLSGASSASGTAIAAEDIFSGEKITFKVTDASTTAEDTVFVIKYDRSAKGAAEKITLNDVNVEVTVNGEAVSIGNKIDFELDPYSSFNPSYDYSSPEPANDQHEYKAKPVINKKLAKDDTVTIEVKSAKVSGEGAGKVDLGKITVAVVDINKAVNYYKEVAVSGEKAEKYIPLITKKNGKGLNEVETPAVNTNENNNNNNNNNENENKDNTTAAPATPAALTKTSILVSSTEGKGIQTGDDVWGSGSSTTKNENGTYNVVGAGAGAGGWGGNIAAIPVLLTAGDLTGFTHIVFEADLSNFTLNDNNDDYPPIELKVANDDDSKTKTINATTLFANGKAEIPLASINFLNEVSKVQFSIRGSGSFTLNDISKAK